MDGYISLDAFFYNSRNSQYQLISQNRPSVKVDGDTQVYVNASGEIDQAIFANGLVVRKLNDYVLVQTEQNGIWFGDRAGLWFIID